MVPAASRAGMTSVTSVSFIILLFAGFELGRTHCSRLEVWPDPLPLRVGRCGCHGLTVIVGSFGPAFELKCRTSPIHERRMQEFTISPSLEYAYGKFLVFERFLEASLFLQDIGQDQAGPGIAGLSVDDSLEVVFRGFQVAQGPFGVAQRGMHGGVPAVGRLRDTKMHQGFNRLVQCKQHDSGVDVCLKVARVGVEDLLDVWKRFLVSTFTKQFT